MKKVALNLLYVSLMTGLLTACSKMNPEEEISELNARADVFVGQDIQQPQIVGTWVIEKAISDVGVDLNSDGAENRDILKETACFDTMYFNFDNAGNLQTLQPKVYFSDGEMNCDATKTYEATYTVSGNTLMVNFTLNGQEVTGTKNIGLSNDAEGEYLHVAISENEVEQFIQDPENTSVSEIGRIEMIYKKK